MEPQPDPGTATTSTTQAHLSWLSQRFFQWLFHHHPVEWRIRRVSDPQTGSASVFCHVIDALRFQRDAWATLPLLALFGNADVHIRIKIIKALGNLASAGDGRAIAPLIDALHHADHYVRAYAIDALVNAGNVCAVDPLIARLADKESIIRLKAACALGEFNDKRAVDPLIVTLKDANGDVRAAARVLGILGDAQALGPLRSLLDDPYGWVVNCAHMAIEQLEALRIGISLSDWPDPH